MLLENAVEATGDFAAADINGDAVFDMPRGADFD